jgi:hypothetical protein
LTICKKGCYLLFNIYLHLFHNNHTIFYLAVMNRTKSKNFAYFNNYCIMYTINLLVSSSSRRSSVVVICVHCRRLGRERKKGIDQFIFSQALEKKRGERERGRGDRLYLQFRRCLPCTKERARAYARIYIPYAARRKWNLFLSPSFSLTCDEKRW